MFQSNVFQPQPNVTLLCVSTRNKCFSLMCYPPIDCMTDRSGHPWKTVSNKYKTIPLQIGLWLNAFADFSKWTRSASRCWSVKTLNFFEAVFNICDESILTKSTGNIFSLSNDLYKEYFRSLIFWTIRLYWDGFSNWFSLSD